MFKTGDKVKIKSWDRMEKEYGLDTNGNISCRCKFVDGMKHLCGETFTIHSISEGYLIRFKGANNSWMYSIDMIEKSKIHFK